MFTQSQIRSYNRTVYAERGEQVHVLSVNGHVAICEGLRGNRFPCLWADLGEERPEEVVQDLPEVEPKAQLTLF